MTWWEQAKTVVNAIWVIIVWLISFGGQIEIIKDYPIFSLTTVGGILAITILLCKGRIPKIKK